MWSTKLIKNVFSNSVATSRIPKLCVWNSSKSIQNKNRSSTIDSAEVELFTKYLNEWWDFNGPFTVMHRLNPIRVALVRDGLVPPAEQNLALPLVNKTILDVGCGGGIFSEGLAELGARVTGIDAGEEIIKVAKAHSKNNPAIANNKPTYYSTTIEVFSKQFSNHFDAVVASEVLEHVNHQELFTKSCIEAVKPGGKIFITTPNRSTMSRFVVIFLAEDVLRIIPKGTHQYEKFVELKELIAMFEKYNCRVELTHGGHYNPITKKWSVTKYDKIWYAIQARKLC
ncbi:ubiquinone biosynthesis O-methyltransferase-like [Anticarsia gemmatalis]|uniref:ubiquinone biosynthesis O-methyltransferase-like n=1 Tax=Anticarsia gemmatalis TaxID=129554 RepID=UPI003F7686E9